MSTEPVTLIVRVWRRPEGFRAEVRPLQGDGRCTFRSADALVAFLERAAARREDDGEEGGC